MSQPDLIALLERVAADRDIMDAAIAAIPGAVTNDWYEFSTATRCEHGAQGVEAVFDSTREATLPFGVQTLTGPVPVDYLFAETRDAAKDAYRALCAEHGNPAEVATQMAELRGVAEMLDQNRAAQEADFVRLAGLLGETLPPIPTAFYAHMTRAEFDAAVAAVERLTHDVDAVMSFTDPETVAEWNRVSTDIHTKFGARPTWATRHLDDQYIDPRLVAVFHAFVAAVPLAFLFDEYRPDFLDAYRVGCENAARAQRAEQRAANARAEAAKQAALRADYLALGKRLGFIDHTNALSI